MSLVLGLVLLTAVLGVPLFVIMGLLALVAFSFAGIQTSAVAVEIYKMAAAPTLLSIPLFAFAGYLMAESGSPKRILRFAESALGWLPGGVAIVSLVICAFFTAFTGASGVTIIALGGLLYPILKDKGFSDKFTLGLITTSGSLGLLFPPSLPLILYGLVGSVDIGHLFKAGLLPGMLLIVLLSLWSLKNGSNILKSRIPFSMKELGLSFKGSAWELFLPVGVLGGIYGGIVTTTEAAALTALYVFMIECFIYKDLKLTKDIPRIIAESMSLVGAILLILCCALGLTNFLVDEEVPMKLFALMKTIIHNKYIFLLFLNIFLLIVGCLMDIFSAIVVVVPLIIPMAREYGVDPVHLAVIFLLNLEIGYVTPPVGINLFISSFRFQKPMVELYRASFPFLIISILALMIVTYVPWLSLVFIK